MASLPGSGLTGVPLRGVIALVLTAVGLVLLLSFRTPDLPAASNLGGGRLGGVLQPSASANSGAVAARGNGAATPPPTAIGQGGRPAATPEPTATVGRGPGTGAIPTPTAPRPTPVPTATAASANATVTGPAVDTPYGPVQVEAKISGGRIIDVVALELPNDRRRSQQISQYVAPILHDEALQAQSAAIDGISGATYTSEGYAQSLQGALDQVHG